MQLRVLGPLEVVGEGAMVELSGAQQRRLLTVLMLTPGQVVTSDRLMSALWGDAPPRSALKSLRAHISRLRSALGDSESGLITTHGGGYALRVGAEQIDAGRFELLVGEARALRSSNPTSALSLLDGAIALWRGPAHADFSDEPFVRADAVRLEELRVHAMEERFDLLLAGGRPGEIIGEIEAFARQHRLRERPQAQLIRALYRAGRQAEALGVFRRFRTTLADELGLEPSAALVTLERDVLRQDPRLDLGGTADGASSQPGRTPNTRAARVFRGKGDADGAPLVERDAQLGALGDLFAAVVVREEGRLAIVRGEAGIGKTALIRTFCDDRPGHHRVLCGACVPLFTPRPLGPIRDVADAVGGRLRAAVAAGAQPYDVAAELSRELCETAPSVLVLEDLHWADEATLDVVRLLGRRVAAVPVLLVLTYRDDEVHLTHPLRRVLGELATTPGVIELPLDPLSVSAVTGLATQHGRDGAHVHAVTGGNPLFVVELLASATDEVPTSVRQMVLGRASGLDEPARVLLEVLAAVPPRIDVDDLAKIAGVEIGDLDACVASGLIVAGASGVAFRHELARRTVAEATPAHRRRAVHRHVLAALASAPAHRRDLAQLAHHAENAGDVDAVLRFADAAGREAARMGAHREAASHFASVLRHADALEPSARADVLEQRARSCYLTDQNAYAIDAMQQAVRLYRRLGDPECEGEALRQLSQFLWCPGRTREAMDRAKRAVELLERLPVGSKLGMTYSNIAQLAMNAEDIEQTTRWSGRALEVADALGDVAIGVHARTNLATIAALAGDPAARASFDDCIAAASASGLYEHVTRALLNRAVSAVRRHEYAEATRTLDRAEEMCRELGHELMLFYVRAYRSVVALDTGDWQRAAEHADLVLRYPRTSTVPRILALSVTALLEARTGSGDPSRALDLADDLAASTDELERMVPPVVARSEIAWLGHRNDEIPRITQQCWELAVARGATWMIGPLAAWRYRAAVTDALPEDVAEPYVLQATGRHAAAARWWSERGCRYAAALSLLDAADVGSIRLASRMLSELGAHTVDADRHHARAG